MDAGRDEGFADMGRWSVVMAGLVGVILASSCSNEAGGWGKEAVAYVDALDKARQQSTRTLLGFYGPETVFDDPTSLGDDAVGRDSIRFHFDEWDFVGAMTEGVRDDFAIDRTGLAIELRWQPEGQSGASHDALVIRELDPFGLATRETLAYAVDDMPDLRRWIGPGFMDGAGAAHDLVAAYVEGWSSSDPIRVGALYDADARIEDSSLGIELVGAAAIRSFVVRHSSSEGAGLGLGTTPDGGDAVYVRWPDGVNDLLADRIEVIVSFASDDGSGCPGRTVARLSIADGRIVHERRYHDVDDLRRCLDTGELAEGWWTGLAPPAPPAGEVTGVVEVDGREVEVYNGTPALDRLVAWGFERFVDAGLGAPAVELVGFGEYVQVEHCGSRRHGRTIRVDGATRLYLCVGEEEACSDGDCGQFRLRVRRLLLHEIGHAWLIDNVGAATQQAFVELMGFERWRGESVPRDQRGVEQAANVLMWGVAEVQIAAMGDRTCGELAAAFELLTGQQPRQTCAQAPGR